MQIEVSTPMKLWPIVLPCSGFLHTADSWVLLLRGRGPCGAGGEGCRLVHTAQVLLVLGVFELTDKFKVQAGVLKCWFWFVCAVV